MKNGPGLEEMLMHLAECPSDMFLPPHTRRGGTIRVFAVVSDLFRHVSAALAGTHQGIFDRPGTPYDVNLLTTHLVTAWFFSHRSFAGAHEIAEPMLAFMRDVIPSLARSVPASDWVHVQERREELTRLALHAVGMKPNGESDAAALDRLAAVDTLGRIGIIRDSLAAMKRAKEVREAMERKAAEEAARKAAAEAATTYGRE